MVSSNLFFDTEDMIQQYKGADAGVVAYQDGITGEWSITTTIIWNIQDRGLQGQGILNFFLLQLDDVSATSGWRCRGWGL